MTTTCMKHKACNKCSCERMKTDILFVFVKATNQILQKCTFFFFCLCSASVHLDFYGSGFGIKAVCKECRLRPSGSSCQAGPGGIYPSGTRNL